jgi:hypothetical protein
MYVKNYEEMREWHAILNIDLVYKIMSNKSISILMMGGSCGLDRQYHAMLSISHTARYSVITLLTLSIR